MAQSTPVVISLERGEEVRGVLEWHDRDSVKLRRPDGLAVVVMKQAIVQAREEPAARHAERTSRKAARTAPRTRRSKPREGSAGDDA